MDNAPSNSNLQITYRIINSFLQSLTHQQSKPQKKQKPLISLRVTLYIITTKLKNQLYLYPLQFQLPPPLFKFNLAQIKRLKNATKKSKSF